MVRPQGEPLLLFLYDVAGAMRAPAAAAHFGRVCAESITQGRRAGRMARIAQTMTVRPPVAKSAQIHQRFLNAN